MIMRSYFIGNIPEALIESANIDGASEFRIYTSLVLPLSKPIMATIGLFLGINYWNDWYNGLIYLTDSNLYNIQNVLNNMLTNIQFLQQNSQVSTSISTELPATTVKMAVAVVGVIPVLIIYPFFQKYFVKGITIGAVKG
jgi:putative aldouronate transport system permease protein